MARPQCLVPPPRHLPKVWRQQRRRRRVIFFWERVSEGEYNTMATAELKAIQLTTSTGKFRLINVVHKMYLSYLILFLLAAIKTIIVVQDRFKFKTYSNLKKSTKLTKHAIFEARSTKSVTKFSSAGAKYIWVRVLLSIASVFWINLHVFVTPTSWFPSQKGCMYVHCTRNKRVQQGLEIEINN